MKKITYFTFLVFSTAVFFYSCKHTVNNNTDLTDKEASKHGSNESKDMSDNCLSCHKSGGSGDGVYTLGGTVFKDDKKTKQANGFIKLYSGPNGTGTLLKTIEVDAWGNFYSDANYNFSLPIYPSAETAAGVKKFMSTSISSGACNSCHGVSTDVITVQ